MSVYYMYVLWKVVLSVISVVYKILLIIGKSLASTLFRASSTATFPGPYGVAYFHGELRRHAPLLKRLKCIQHHFQPIA